MVKSAKMPRWLVRSLLVLAALAVAGVAGWYSPWITASLWHVFHPRGWVDYRGLQVKVPWPWIADAESGGDDSGVTPQGLALRKLPPNMLHGMAAQSLFVTVISADRGFTPERQTQSWLEMFRASHPGATFDSATPVAIPPGVSCLSADIHTKPEDVQWTCISVSGGWVANFEGHQRDEPAFFEVIGGLKR